MTTTTLVTPDGKTMTRTGTSGFTVTAQPGAVDVADVHVQIEYAIASKDELQAMTAMLLVFLEEQLGERFVAQCIGHYAADTGKQFMEAGDGHKLVMIRGSKPKP